MCAKNPPLLRPRVGSVSPGLFVSLLPALLSILSTWSLVSAPTVPAVAPPPLQAPFLGSFGSACALPPLPFAPESRPSIEEAGGRGSDV